MTTEPNTAWSVWEYSPHSEAWKEQSQWPTEADAEKASDRTRRIYGANTAIALPFDKMPNEDTPRPSYREVKVGSEAVTDPS